MPFNNIFIVVGEMAPCSKPHSECISYAGAKPYIRPTLPKENEQAARFYAKLNEAPMNRLLPSKLPYKVRIRLDPHQGPYTNGDEILGSVAFEVHSQAEVSQIQAVLHGVSLTMLEDARLTPQYEGHGESHDIIVTKQTLFPQQGLAPETFTFPEGQHQYRFLFVLPKDDYNLQCLSEGGFLHKRGYAKEDQLTPPVTLPPLLEYEKGANHYAKIQYYIEVVVLRGSKTSVEASQEFTFFPKLNLVTFSTLKIADTNVLGKGFELKYKAESDTESGLKSLLQKALPTKVNAPFELHALFIPHLEPYNTQYNTPRVVQAGDQLQDILELLLLTTMLHDELVARVFGKDHEPERLILQGLTVKLVSYLVFKSQIFNDTREFKTVVLDNQHLNHVIMHEDFESVGTLMPEGTKGSLEVESVLKSHDGEFYRYTFPKSILEGTLNALVPSFAACNVKMEHRLHITARIGLSWNPKAQATVRTKPRVVFLKEYKRGGRDNEWESLPLYRENT